MDKSIPDPPFPSTIRPRRRTRATGSTSTEAPAVAATPEAAGPPAPTRHPWACAVGPGDRRQLWLSRREVTDLTPILALPDLEEVHLAGTQVKEIEPLAQFPNLKVVDLSGTGVVNLTPLSGLVALQALHLANTAVEDLLPLASLPGLQILNLRQTLVCKLWPLEGLPDLRWLFLDDSQVSDVAALYGIASLRWLTLRRTPLSLLQVEAFTRWRLTRRWASGSGRSARISPRRSSNCAPQDFGVSATARVPRGTRC